MKDEDVKRMAEDVACGASKRVLEMLREVRMTARTALLNYETWHDDYELSTSRQYGALLGASEHAAAAIKLMEEKLLITQTTKNRMKKQILIDRKGIGYLADAFKVTREQVHRALRFERNSDAARSMRAMALQNGGALVGGEAVDDEMEHDTARGLMVQNFSSRIRLTVDLHGGSIIVWIDRKVAETYHNLTIPEFMKLQDDLRLRAATL